MYKLFSLIVSVSIFAVSAVNANLTLDGHGDRNRAQSFSKQPSQAQLHISALIDSIPQQSPEGVVKLLDYITFHDHQIIKFMHDSDLETMNHLLEKLSQRFRNNPDVFQIKTLAQFAVLLDHIEKAIGASYISEEFFLRLLSLNSVHGELILGVAAKNPSAAREYLELAVNRYDTHRAKEFFKKWTGHEAGFPFSFLNEDDVMKALARAGVISDVESFINPPGLSNLVRDLSWSFFRHQNRKYILGMVPLMTGPQLAKVMGQLYFQDHLIFLSEFLRIERFRSFTSDEIRQILSTLVMKHVTPARDRATFLAEERAFAEFELVFTSKYSLLAKQLKSSPEVLSFLNQKTQEWFDISSFGLKFNSLFASKKLSSRGYEVASYHFQKSPQNTEMPSGTATLSTIHPRSQLNSSPSQLLELSKSKNETPSMVLKIFSFDQKRELVVFDGGKVILRNLNGTNLRTYEDVSEVNEKGAQFGLFFNDRQVWLSKAFLWYVEMTSEPNIKAKSIWKKNPNSVRCIELLTL